MVRFDRWDVDYKPEPNDTTGPNILLKALPRLSFLDTSTGLLVSKRKIPKDCLKRPKDHTLLSPCGIPIFLLQKGSVIIINFPSVIDNVPIC